MSAILAKVISPVKTVIDKATTDDKTPTAGYLFNEINKLTYSSVENCQELEDYLIVRLKKDSIFIKLKVLRVIKHTILKGHKSFRIGLQRRTSSLQEYLNYRGPSDPLNGDMYNKSIRDEAQEIMKLLFTEGIGGTNDTYGKDSSSSSSSSSQSSSDYNFSSSYVGGKIMTGTGNYTPPTSTSVTDRMFNSLKKIATVVSKTEEDSSFDPNIHWSPKSFTLSNTSGLPPSTQVSVDIGSRSSKPGNAGGSWGASYQPPSFNSLYNNNDHHRSDYDDEKSINHYSGFNNNDYSQSSSSSGYHPEYGFIQNKDINDNIRTQKEVKEEPPIPPSPVIQNVNTGNVDLMAFDISTTVSLTTTPQTQPVVVNSYSPIIPSPTPPIAELQKLSQNTQPPPNNIHNSQSYNQPQSQPQTSPSPSPNPPTRIDEGKQNNNNNYNNNNTSNQIASNNNGDETANVKNIEIVHIRKEDQQVIQHTIDQLTRGGGLKNDLTRAELANFQQRVISFHIQPILSTVTQKFNSSVWQERYRALCLFEFIFSSPSFCNSNPETFNSYCDANQQLRAVFQSSSQKAIRDKVRHILNLIFPPPPSQTVDTQEKGLFDQMNVK